MDIADPKSVTKQYSWSGDLIGFRYENTFVPVCVDNNEYKRIVDRIEKNECVLVEPTITWAIKVLDSKGSMTGYDTDLGFVTYDLSNKFYIILGNQLANGSCEVRTWDINEHPQPRIKSLIFCIIFDRSWPFIKNTLIRPFPFTIEDSFEHEFIVRIRNIPDTPHDAVRYLLREFDAENLASGNFRPIQNGLLEIEIPTAYLSKLFRNAKEDLDPWFKDQLYMHYVRTGRKKGNGPEIGWLIQNAANFIRRYLVDTANSVIHAFSMEFGGSPPGHVGMRDPLQSNLSFARLEDGTTRLQHFSHVGSLGLNLSGDPSDHLGQQYWTNAASNLRPSYSEVRSRVMQLREAGFSLEAIIVINSWFEIVLRDTYEWALRQGGFDCNVSTKQTYSARLRILNSLLKKDSHDYNSKFFTQIYAYMKELYDIRNNYAHGLNITGVMSLRYDKLVMIEYYIEKFIDLSFMIRFFNYLDGIQTRPTLKSLEIIRDLSQP